MGLANVLLAAHYTSARRITDGSNRRTTERIEVNRRAEQISKILHNTRTCFRTLWPLARRTFLRCDIDCSNRLRRGQANNFQQEERFLSTKDRGAGDGFSVRSIRFLMSSGFHGETVPMFFEVNFRQRSESDIQSCEKIILFILIRRLPRQKSCLSYHQSHVLPM